MSVLLASLATLLHLGLLLIMAPLVAGLLDSLVAVMTRGPGVPVLLAWRDLARLWRKAAVTQENLSLASSLMPVIELGVMITALLLVPSFTVGMVVSPLADLLVVAALLIAGRVTRVVAAFDSGSAAPGLAAEGSAALAVLGETALLLCIVALGMMAGSLNIDQIVMQQQDGLLPAIASTVALTALLGVMLTETASTDGTIESLFNGPDLALMRLSSWLRRLVWINLTGALFLPISMSVVDAGPAGWLIGLLAWLTKLFLFLFCFAAVQTMLGRIPRHSLPDVIGVAALLALLAVVIVLSSSGAT